MEVATGTPAPGCRRRGLRLLLSSLVAAAGVAATAPAAFAAAALTIDCGPRDDAFGPSGGGAEEAVWIPLDGSDRSTDWSGNAPQTLSYHFTPALPAGLYRVRYAFTIQPGYSLALSLLANGRTLLGPVSVAGPPAGNSVYPLRRLEARYRYTEGPLTITLRAEHIPGGDRIRAIRLDLTSLEGLVAAGNLAPEAQVAVDSETNGYPAAALNDGTTEYSGPTQGRSWCPAETAQDHWATFALAQPESIDHVVLYWACYPREPDVYNTAREVLIQYPRDGQWVTVQRLTPAPGSRRTVLPCPAFSAATVRVFMPAGKGPENRPNLLWLNEVELYRTGTWSDPAGRGTPGATAQSGGGPSGRPLPYEPTPRLTDAELFGALDLSRPGLEQVQPLLDKGDLAGAKRELVAYFRRRTVPPRPACRYDPLYYPDALPRDQAADQWLQGRYYLYKTYSWVELGRPIDWFLPQGNPSDRYYITCMTLMHFMVDRWETTREPRYLSAYMGDIRSWYETAPSPLDPPVFPSHHLPWSGIETAFRAGSVTEDYFRMCESPLLDPDYHLLLYKFILEHARFLSACDGGMLSAGNHQMGHLVGLLELAAYWPEFREAAYWRFYTRELLLKHFQVDLYPDGGNVDLGLDYAVMVINRLYTTAYLYAQVAGVDLGPEWLPSLQRQLRWALNVTDPSGGHLGIGDSSPRTDFPGYSYGGRSTTAIHGALLFGDPVMKTFAEQAAPGDLEAWARRLFGARAQERLEAYRQVVPQPPDWTSVNLPDTGWTILRSDWSPRALYLFVDHHRGGHIHYNMNDINVIAYGRQFLTDPGMPHTYSDGSYAAWYRRTRAHNTIEIDGQDMPYAGGDRGTFFSGGSFDYLAVNSAVYKGIGVGTYLRQILFIRDGFWLVDDYLAGQGEHTYAWRGHYPPMPLDVDSASAVVLTANAAGPNLGLFACATLPLTVETGSGPMNIPCDHLCEEVPDAPTLALTTHGALPAGYGVLLLPVPEGRPRGSLARLEGEGGPAAGAGYAVTTPQGAGFAGFSHGEPGPHIYGPLAWDGRAAYVCGDSTAPRRLLLAGGTQLDWNSVRLLELTPRGSVAVEYAGDTVSISTDLAAGKLQLLAPGANTLTLNRRPLAFARTGDFVQVDLR